MIRSCHGMCKIVTWSDYYFSSYISRNFYIYALTKSFCDMGPLWYNILQVSEHWWSRVSALNLVPELVALKLVPDPPGVYTVHC